MNQHIVHIFSHGSCLSKQRGMMVCNIKDTEETHELPIEDIRAVIVAAKGISISMELMSALMESNAVILHCDGTYKPIGITSGIERVIRSEAIINQANCGIRFHGMLWKKIIESKVANQARVLEKYGKNPAYLNVGIRNGEVNESSCARYYWQEYFSIFNLFNIQRRSDDPEGINAKMNYGYAVLGALIHRSIIAHGLSPVFGMHHVARYKANAFVYDLMEPWRAFADDFLVKFEKEQSGGGGDGIKEWAHFIAGSFRKTKIQTPGEKLEIYDAIDVFVASVATCYSQKSNRYLWTPEL